ncbi:MAG TPA: O-antigen ligase family protein [Candidatus Paceibacterota bacterium]|nr:O-antigen ligase family protein [Candidatus Paceibacterota bacterium]
MSLQKILRWVVIIGIFALPFVPLIVSTSLFFPYITGKNFTFRIIVELIAGAWLALALMDPHYRPKRGWILGAFALFILVIALADAQGVNPFKSFWSNYERMDGWVTIAHLFVYFVIASAVMNTENLWRALFLLSVWISSFLSGLGLLQILGLVNFGSGGTGLSARIDVTFGNPIYLAVYMLFNIFIAALLWSQEGRQGWSVKERYALPAVLLLTVATILIPQQGQALPVLGGLTLAYIIFVLLIEGLMLLPQRYLFSVIILIDTFALFFTGTRGTMIGLALGAVVTSVLLIIMMKNKNITRLAGGILALILVFGGVVWIARDSAFVQKVGFLDRLATISSDDTTIQSRIINMETAWNGVKERPILGWGQEDYAIVFDKYYDPRMYADEQWFDRVHNIIFDWLIAGGVVGLASYLSIFAATLWVLWRKNKSGGHTFTVAERSIITGLLAGYFFHNLTVFDNVTSYILFGTVLAYIAWRTDSKDNAPPIIRGDLVPNAASPFIVTITIGLGLVAVWAINWNALQENVTLLNALTSPNLATFEKAISYGTYGTQEAREQLAQIAAQAAAAPSQNVSDAVKQQFFTTAINQMQLQEKASPLDARFPLFTGTIEDSFGDYADAAQALQAAHELSPNKQSILFQIGFNQQALNDLSGAEQTFKQAYELDIHDQMALGYYIEAAVRAGDDATAQNLLTPSARTSSSVVTQRLASAFASRNAYSKIIPIWSAYLAANPTDVNAYTTLAAAYFQTGNTSDAITTLQALGKAVPSSAAQAESLIQEIQGGAIKK